MKRGLMASVMVAALLWFYMFSPWTAGLTNFWVTMAVAGASLLCMACRYGRLHKLACGWFRRTTPREWGRQLLLGLLVAAVLWGLFWVGDKLSSALFSFARPEVDHIYGMKGQMPAWLIACLLLVVIGPAEELFWRGYVQRTLRNKVGANGAFVATLLVYTLIHVWSGNIMLLMAAFVAGLAWGLMYRLRPSWLPALVLSHAVWDATVFVLLPI